MSLEQAIKDLTAAVEANTKALAGGGGAKSSGGSKSSSSGGSSKKKITIDAVAKKFSAYLASEGDDAKAMVRKVVKHFDVPKITELAEDQFEDALAMLAKIEDGEDPFDDDDGSLV